MNTSMSFNNLSAYKTSSSINNIACAVCLNHLFIVQLEVCTSQSPLPISLIYPTSGNCFLYLWVGIIFFVCFACLDSIFKWGYIWHFFLWLLLLSMIPSKSICVAANYKISFLARVLHIYIKLVLFWDFFFFFWEHSWPNPMPFSSHPGCHLLRKTFLDHT